MPHSNRSKNRDKAGANPTPDQVRDARVALNMTRHDAARIIYCTERSWQSWEIGDRPMHAAFWELFNIKSKNK